MVDIFGMDLASLSSIANIFSGLATLVLAYFTWKTIVQSRKEYAVTRKQLLLAQREKDPKIVVESKSFSKDTLSLGIKNRGKSDAQSIAVITSFSPAKLDIREWRADEKGNRIPYGVHVPIFKKIHLTIGGKKTEYNPEDSTNYISRGKKNPIVLPPNASTKATLDLIFLFQNMNKSETTGRTFTELKTVLLENGIDAVSINLSLEYKNNLEDIVDRIHLADFIFDSRKHNSLEDAVKDGFGYELRWLGKDEIETKFGWSSYSSYKGKSSRNYFEEEKELEQKI